MENIIMKSMMNHQVLRVLGYARLSHTQANPKYPDKKKNIMTKVKKTHPYRLLHPWKSKLDFCDSMIKQVIYNKDGLVAINKPYGISSRTLGEEKKGKNAIISGIFNEKKYVLTDALPLIANALGYESLVIAKTPEKYTSGIVLLSASDKVTEAVAKSLRVAEGKRIIPRTYWTVTRRVPIFPSGERRVAMKLAKGPEKGQVEPVIISSWSENERARGDIKILNVQFKVLSSATHNLASLLEIKSSTSQWHAVRLFAAITLLSPILGDRVYGSRAQDVMGKFLAISPFVEAAHVPPRLDEELLQLIKITQSKTLMIPAHVHLREMFLPSFMKKGNDVSIVAPLQPGFLWTCKKLLINEEFLKPTDNIDSSSSSDNPQNDVENCLAVRQN
ncbi:mitochondrial mRNA pseudouridine synthase RPUSD3 [Microplitis demolitor]|uniref:mitochondrial mRNA pseudouridine synthase RPUSD3 n=1 Tax=Microplitis demolitor TaxID=69319 RepID=UPI0004CD2B99|nr:mitochondrial mRNA pseudouridine synthase RPUSD3 [Microplitis demolitor]XP_053593363.1 mitochondrial mRNA pseudouridine synthase RPUSD3 [Microplitis demolitor]